MKNVGVSRVFLPQHRVGEKFLDFMFFNVSRGNTKKRWESLYYERKRDTCLYIKSLDAVSDILGYVIKQ